MLIWDDVLNLEEPEFVQVVRSDDDSGYPAIFHESATIESTPIDREGRRKPIYRFESIEKIDDEPPQP